MKNFLLTALIVGFASTATADTSLSPHFAPNGAGLVLLANYDAYNSCLRTAGDRHRDCIRGCNSLTSTIAWNQCSNRCAQILSSCNSLRPAPSPARPVAPR